MYQTNDSDEVETHKFQTNVPRFLQKFLDVEVDDWSVFLKALVSNANDALLRRHFESLRDCPPLSDSSNLSIKVIANRKDGTLTIIDTGVGMTKDELVKYLGTVGESGSKDYMESKGPDNQISLSGKFGLGFYTVFKVAHTVQVITGKNQCPKYCWEASSLESYTIRQYDVPEDSPSQGTKVVLYMKEEFLDFIELDKLEKALGICGGIVEYPIRLAEREEEEGTIVNKIGTIWQIPSETYQLECYKWLSNGAGGYFAASFFDQRPGHAFKALLFIASTPPSVTGTSPNGRIRLYKSREIIVSDGYHVPCFDKFVYGIVDICEEVELNLAKTWLSNATELTGIDNAIIEYCFDMLIKLSQNETEYMKFYNVYGSQLKESIHAYYGSARFKQTMLSLLRFYSTKSRDRMISLDDYIARLGEGETHIFCVTGDSLEIVSNSAFLKPFMKDNIEVIFMTDPRDDLIIRTMTYYKHHRLVNISMGVDDPEEVRGYPVPDTPSWLVTAMPGETVTLKRLLHARELYDNSFFNKNDPYHVKFNSDDPIVKFMSDKENRAKYGAVIKDIRRILTSTAQIESGVPVEDAGGHAALVYALVQKHLETSAIETSKEEELEEVTAGVASLVAGDDPENSAFE